MGLHTTFSFIHGRITVVTFVLYGAVPSFMLTDTRSHICPSCDMEFISTLLTIFRTSCCPHVLIMSGKGDVNADGQS